MIIVNALNIGTSFYSGGLKVGYYSLNGLYVPTFSILMIVFYYKSIPTRKKRVLGLIFSLICTIILLILLKRTLILILIIGLFIYFIKTFSIKRIVKTSIFVIALGTIGFFFRESFIESFESRSSRFDQDYDPTQEGRFTEIIYIYLYMSEKPMTMIFGTGEAFNDRKTVSKIYGTDREAHNSFIRLFWSSGLIGLLLYISICFKQFMLSRKYYLESKRMGNIKVANTFFFIMVFISIRFLNDFSSGITYLGYNAFSFIFIAGAFRIYMEMQKNIHLHNTNKSIFQA